MKVKMQVYYNCRK